MPMSVSRILATTDKYVSTQLEVTDAIVNQAGKGVTAIKVTYTV